MGMSMNIIWHLCVIFIKPLYPVYIYFILRRVEVAFFILELILLFSVEQTGQSEVISSQTNKLQRILTTTKKLSKIPYPSQINQDTKEVKRK